MNKREAIKNSLIRITQGFSTWNLKKTNKKLKSKGLPIVPLIQKTSIFLQCIEKNMQQQCIYETSMIHAEQVLELQGLQAS